MEINSPKNDRFVIDTPSQLLYWEHNDTVTCRSDWIKLATGLDRKISARVSMFSCCGVSVKRFYFTSNSVCD